MTKKTTNKEGNMTPIRKDEKEHYKIEINKKFRYKAQSILNLKFSREAQDAFRQKKEFFSKIS